ncbi:MAG: AsnC family transcriptional regulator [Deltaproteobacteria bacterium]|nr:AsnC family transcriptional regulator [Deltaproteobacteria bacterium]MBW1929709.1 AsnC family transcriptional regulator [Deltaproteobacteria bacterium]MBW2023999.1 AsnC family transcriptional regulator [Deltaproteobacteria bacterium]MBW2125017.1 AsnC family transcriptional regulator [Deltaproteobacteria bacterium]RLB17271.1 MAG: Lrp/AsnC family transcriptional regulator [Deltaproteobacteria bacterium]
MDEIDKQILNEIQSHFPIAKRPYQIVGERLGLSESEVLERVKRLKKKGVIRRIGGNFHSHRLDFTSTLCAAKVPEEKLKLFVDTVNSYPGVTHNYLRNHPYNVWFTFIAEDMDFIKQALREISEKTGVKEILNLPAVKMFKIKVHFDV